MKAAARRLLGAAALTAMTVLAVLTSTLAGAALPAAYGALVISPSGLPERAEFDLTAAQAQARREGKRLYVYLGANECPFCRKYESFLALNATELIPHFGNYLIVDLRSQCTELKREDGRIFAVSC